MKFRFFHQCLAVLLSYTIFFTSTLDAQFLGLGKKIPMPDLSSFITKMEPEIAKQLGTELPLTLNAADNYPTVPDADLPGGPFQGQPLSLTVDTLAKPLPQGDHIVTTTFFCSEYSTHQPGNNYEYDLAPAKGKLSTAISTLLWRGMIVRQPPHDLQLVSWAIQGGVPYVQMPDQYKKIIDQLLPDFKDQLNGQGLAKIKNNFEGGAAEFVNTYNKWATLARKISLNRAPIPTLPIPTFDSLLHRLGTRNSNLALDAERQYQQFTANETSEQIRAQKIYGGQGTPLPPQPATNGRWTKLSETLYLRYKVASGNLSSDNLLELRVLPSRTTSAALSNGAHLIFVGLQGGATVIGSPTFLDIFGGTIDRAVLGRLALAADPEVLLAVALALTVKGLVGYPQGHGAQVPVITPGPIPPTQPITPSAVASSAGESPRPDLTFPQSELPASGDRPYVPPKQKGNPEVVPAKGGGYQDTDGNVWQWAKDQHGGPHWDVQHPNGQHTNVTPTGKVIGKDKFPNKPRDPKSNGNSK